MNAPAKTKLPGSLDTNRRLDQWLKFESNGTITVYTGKVEIGQGVVTAMAQIAAEELDVTLAKVRMLFSRLYFFLSCNHSLLCLSGLPLYQGKPVLRADCRM